MTADGSSRADPDGDERRLGVCLDIDGTVYRSGSVFVESLGFLPYAADVSTDDADARHLRTALAAVAEFRGGTVGKVKWLGVFSVLDLLRTAGANRVSEALLDGLVERRAERSLEGDGRSSGTRPERLRPRALGDYRSMQRTVLTAYGRFLRGKRAEVVERAVEEIVAERCRVDPGLEALLSDVSADPAAEVALVTDMPEHVASAYARTLDAEAVVRGTRFETDAEGRYTGRFETVDKGATVARLRADRGWTRVVAAGDSSVDLAMADEAEVFLAVAGQGDISRRLEGDPAERVVRVGPGERFEPALREVVSDFEGSQNR